MIRNALAYQLFADLLSKGDGPIEEPNFEGKGSSKPLIEKPRIVVGSNE